jgi:hypothetical protein
MPHSKTNRRTFLKQSLFAGGVVAGSAIPLSVLAEAADTVSEEEAMSVSMGYRHDAAEVDVAAFPKRAGDEGQKQYCFNCSLYQGGKDDEWAACAIFQNRKVAGRGWCNAWVAKV